MAFRTFYAVALPGFSKVGNFNYTPAHGVTSIGVTTSFSLEAVLELGQLNLYQLYEKVPEIEVTMEKNLDGYPLLWHLATQGAGANTITSRGTQSCIIGFSIYDDVQYSASGTPVASVYMSGLFPSASSFSFPIDGNFTESISFVGNHKQWLTILASGNPSSVFAPSFDNTDQPVAITGSGGLQRRQNLLFTPTVNTLDSNGMLNDPNCTILPGGSVNGIPGITSSGTNPLTGPNGSFAAHLQGITVSAQLNREELFELGRRFNYNRFLGFPLQITCEITAIATQGDQISATQGGVSTNGNNLPTTSIKIATKEGTRIDLGTNCKLASSNMSGPDTGGANMSVVYSYETYNFYNVSHWNDPNPALAVAMGGVGGL